jgi:hypothetical protein
MTTTETTPRFGAHRRMYLMHKRIIGAALLVASLTACDKKSIDITNPNNPTVSGASADPAAVQLLATGLLADYRGSRGGPINDWGRFGRESYVYTPQEGRNTSHYLIGIGTGANQKLDPSGFAVGEWGTPYVVLRDVFNFKNAVATNGNFSAAQKSAALGFAKTIEAAMLMQVVLSRDTIGGVVEVKSNAADLAPFVSRDSMYKYILASLDSALTALAAGSAAFPFALHSGYAGFNTPATYAQFTNGLKARAAIYYATEGGPASAWQTALTALGNSFLNAGAATRAALDVGVYEIYSGATGDALNPFNAVTNGDLYAHMSIQADVQMKADGTPDNRYIAKIRTAPTRNSPGSPPFAAPSSLAFNIWPTNTAPIDEMRNEELILLRAEARLATGDKAGAIADLNTVRTVSGGLPASTLTAASTNDQILTGILYEKRYSLLMEGHRWIDMRRYGKLNLLPLDVTSGVNTNFVAKVMPVPQAECLVRAGKTGSLAGPGC